ncbi:MAG TPA: PilZ domain-containing protein, partial [Candidatus Acidoferrales bacterium]|nr:PilZ domain-containing protein [Candidatus Acidoferrales bacterium]
QATARFLRSLQVLLRSVRLYQKNHPRVLESLEATEQNLRAALALLSEIIINVDRGRLVVGAPDERVLPDHHGELGALAQELYRCGITSLIFLPETNLGELDKLAQSVNSFLQRGRAPRVKGLDWRKWTLEHRVFGIRVNTPPERKVNAVLAGLVAELRAYGSSDRAPQKVVAWAELSAALNLLARLGALLERPLEDKSKETIRTFQAELAEADRQAVNLVASAITRQPPDEEEASEAYLARLGNALLLEFAIDQFRGGSITPPELCRLFARISSNPANVSGSALLARWSDDTYPEHMCEAFWKELPVRERATVVRGPHAWCVPVGLLRHYLEHLANAGPDASPGASPREARIVLLNYARCLESEDGKARRAVAAGLAELYPLVDQLWPHQFPEELSRGAVRALASEASPGIAGLLAAATENLARLALRKGDYAEFERILQGLESAPGDSEHAHMAALAGRIVADERWLTLIEAALFNRPRGGPNVPFDPVLLRLLCRDPERLLDRLTLILTGPSGLEALPAMARLLRAMGEPVMMALEARLWEPRRRRATAAIKLLAATQPERLLAALPRGLASWDWNLQDLAVSELARTAAPGAALAFAATVSQAHPMVAPMMLDQIGLAHEAAAVPLLLEVAAGENERLRDIFTRIKAIEALGRLRASEAADVLRAVLGKRNGLTHAEPAGLRAAAEEALGLIENRPLPKRLRAAYEAFQKGGASFTRPRRYLRVPLSSPFAAHIEGASFGPARVRTISLGGAFLESEGRLAVGDAIRVEIRTGVRRIQGTAVVRNVAPNGGGVEFVHMLHKDREKLRQLVRRLLRG